MNTVNRSISLTKVCITKLSLWMWYCTFTSLTDGYGAQQKCNVRKHIGHCVHRSLYTRPECFCLSITCYIKRCRPQTTIFVGSDIILGCHLCHVTGCFPSEFQMSISDTKDCMLRTWGLKARLSRSASSSLSLAWLHAGLSQSAREACALSLGKSHLSRNKIKISRDKWESC